MIAVHFRFVEDDGTPTEWIGLAVAGDMKDLFWVIDEAGDPYSCEILPTQRALMCINLATDETEFDCVGESDGWYIPDWKEYDVYNFGEEE